ncbi:ABC transporter substrate-binding protein [Roseibium algae]|uniref:ABC transporter substrate-binding protein n=1 Tax=Roseibium algae TaxID=3123038 RepID=A0ABU8TIW9_9HYPH
MRIIRLAAAAALVLAAVGGAQAKDWSKIRIGTEGAYPPFNSLTSDGKLVGFDIDIANALCEQMKVECEFVVQDWDGMIPALKAGKFDAVIASMSITPERLEQVDFTNKYYNTGPAIMVPKDSPLTGMTDEDLKGVVLGAQSSTTHSNYAEEKFPSAELKLYPTPDEYKLDLENGRIDAAIDDVVVLSDWLKSDDGACCKLLGSLKPDLKINGEGAGIAIRKNEDELKAMFNEAIAGILASGKYKEINDKNFEFDVYGG